MTHVATADELLRDDDDDKGGDDTLVAIAVPFGLHIFEHELPRKALRRLVEPSSLRPAGSPPRWTIRGDACVPVESEDEMSDDGSEDRVKKQKRRGRGLKEKKKPRRLLAFVTAGRYVNSIDARAEYAELSALGASGSGSESKAQAERRVLDRREEIARAQAARHARLGARYETHNLGGALCAVLAQCLKQLGSPTMADDIEGVWASLYKNRSWLLELEAAATRAGNAKLAATAKRLRSPPVCLN